MPKEGSEARLWLGGGAVGDTVMDSARDHAPKDDPDDDHAPPSPVKAMSKETGAGNLVALRPLPGRPRTKRRDVAPPSAEASRHPAYEPLFEAHAYVGGSTAAALALVAEFWDEAEQGSLPDERTVQRWARDDEWDRRWLTEIQERGDKQTALVNLGLQGLQLLAIRGAREILLEQGNPKFATAKRGIFRDVMFLSGAGIIGSRYGAVDTSAAREDQDIATTDADLSTDELLARQAAEYRRSKGGRRGWEY